MISLILAATLNVSSIGFDPEDSTKYIQQAINSGAETVVLDKQSKPWVTRSLWLRSNLTMVIPKGVGLIAKRGEFHDQGARMIGLDRVKNVTITGGGTIRMWIEDYTNANKYVWSEWRHCISIGSVENLTIDNIRIYGAGGDGIYLGRTRGCEPSKHVVIRNVICKCCNRQGLSVICADDLLIENCIFEDTCGTKPMAGIDFEPNSEGEYLTNIRVKNTICRRNHGSGFDFSVGNISGATRPISISLEGCRSEGNYNPVKFHMSRSPLSGFRGMISLSECHFDDTNKSLLTLKKQAADVYGGVPCGLTVKNCTAANPENPSATIKLNESDGYGWPVVKPAPDLTQEEAQFEYIDEEKHKKYREAGGLISKEQRDDYTLTGARSYYFNVPEGTEKFILVGGGAKPGMSMSFKVSDPNGKLVKKIGDAPISRVAWRSGAKPMAGVWKVEVDAGSTGKFEKYLLKLYGIDSVFYKNPEKVLKL